MANINVMNPNLVNFQALQDYTGLIRPSAIENWLQKYGIPYWHNAKGDPITTLEALNNRLINDDELSSNDDDHMIDFSYAKKTQKS